MSIFDDCDMCVGKCSECEKAVIPYKVGMIDAEPIVKKAALIMLQEKFHNAYIKRLEEVMDMQDTMHEWLPIHAVQFADEVIDELVKKIGGETIDK